MDAAPVLLFDQLDSTNAEARRRAEAGEAGPLWITTRRQTQGRGRRGREWASQDGNLFATLLHVVTKSPAEAAQITFIAALAVADLLDRYAPPSLVTIKWPNDVMLAGVKASGILVESGAHASGGLWLAVGIGVNLSHAPQGTERPAAALVDHLAADVAAPPAIEVASRQLADVFAVWLHRWDTLGFQPILDAWAARTPGLDGPAIARLGHETVEGLAEGVAADGALKLRLGDGSLRLISAGDVFFGEAA
ncbi:MAG: biotin--[acetyl-CoA-carboxylase] ligase [Brevundimonas sp.]|uniref:biotin--[acetyl-CoA-carboxylase] ligase n=1 Tax=Brevundimonas sp. TaxID=1871086 RepID=UPI001A310062|nr:biotin--[acetyl-CoA-carboxylase] ligase [Brevundimonas sp.]MBJ7447123.1 biotin--[acetyl-CoA-carboxylase] ligase [Brevundimonas sp.]